MKRIWFFILTVLSTGCLLLAADTWGRTKENGIQAEIAGEVLRFHVRANSEASMDQQIKMQVKEAVVSYLQPRMTFVKDVQGARKLLASQLDEIQQVAEKRLEGPPKKAPRPYEVQVFLKKEYFPEKTYGDCTFPAGEYQALVIELGKGQGHNWWCMLYPGLCFIDETYAVVSEEKKEDLERVLTEDAFDWVTDPKKREISFRWKWLKDMVHKYCG